MIMYPIIAGLFLIGVISNIMEPTPDWTEILGGAAIALVMLTMWAWMWFSSRRRRETIEWLFANQKEITDEPKYFRHSPFPTTPISTSTQLRDFKVVTSALIITISHNIGSDLRGSPFRGIVATLWTLLFGWWGIPWGPIKTVQALITNFSGGTKTPVTVAISPSEMPNYLKP